MIPFSNWFILFFLHFAFLFLIGNGNKKKSELSSVSTSLIIIYSSEILVYLISIIFNFRFLSSLLITSSVYIVFFFLSKRIFTEFKFEGLKVLNIFITIISAVCFAFFIENLFNTSSFENLDFYIISNGYIYAFLFLCVLPAIFEEFFFRGVVLNKLLKIYSNTNAVLISAVFFGFIHFVFHPLTSFIYLFLLGIILGLIKIKFKNIAYTIIFHLVYNLMVLIIL